MQRIHGIKTQQRYSHVKALKSACMNQPSYLSATKHTNMTSKSPKIGADIQMSMVHAEGSKVSVPSQS